MNWKENDRFHVSGDSCDLGIEDYNVRVCTDGTLLETPNEHSEKALVTLDSIDGDGNATVLINVRCLKPISA